MYYNEKNEAIHKYRFKELDLDTLIERIKDKIRKRIYAEITILFEEIKSNKSFETIKRFFLEIDKLASKDGKREMLHMVAKDIAEELSSRGEIDEYLACLKVERNQFSRVYELLSWYILEN